MITVLGRFKTITEARDYAERLELAGSEDRKPPFIYKGHRGYVVAAKQDDANAQQ